MTRRRGRPKGARNRKHWRQDYRLCIEMARLQRADPALSDWSVARQVAPQAVGYDGDNSHQGKCVRRLHDHYVAEKARYLALARARDRPPISPVELAQSSIGIAQQIERQWRPFLKAQEEISALARLIKRLKPF
jgi:hypothetical protein